ncbi:amine sulfotransferase-like [Pollicipes pollicipes]|uniref:amine sulfotransferase-like n=1 Tax=Pollicipes pollicipes TaxID=41117 RepID=UPI001884BCB6|nr:amine sulfotransferase-like [Pollicipes pollicipes]
MAWLLANDCDFAGARTPLDQNRYTEDALVSYYHHFSRCRVVKYSGSLEDLAEDYMAGRLPGLPFFSHQLTDEQVGQLCSHLDFAGMKNNKHANSLMYQDAGILDMPSFIREGQVGSWKQQLSADTDRRLNDWIRRSVEGTGLTFQGVQ